MASPDDTNPTGDETDVDHADLQAALGDLLSGDDTPANVRSSGGEPSDLGSDELDLSMLEDAVAELGIDVGNKDEESGTPREINVGDQSPSAKRNMGLDLTELPPPPGAPVQTTRKLPPLGQASAADLFGEEEDWDDGELGGDFDLGADDGPSEIAPPPAYEAAPQDDPIQLPAPEPDAPRANPATDEVIAFAAHKGRLSGEIASKAKKLFGR